jgi:hypothetical protein
VYAVCRSSLLSVRWVPARPLFGCGLVGFEVEGCVWAGGAGGCTQVFGTLNRALCKAVVAQNGTRLEAGR